MATVNQPELIHAFILKHFDQAGLSQRIAAKFGVTPQAANRHVHALVQKGILTASGNTKSRVYKLALLAERVFQYKLDGNPQEDDIWVKDIRPLLQDLPANVLEIWHWAFTEMFNNAVDHSGGTTIRVHVERTANDADIIVSDNGVGIFAKIQRALDLPDERLAIFELSKGKLTTDSERHSGQGIFFTSRMVSSFHILSDGFFFSHEKGREADWLSEKNGAGEGTSVFMRMENTAKQTVRKILATYSVNGSYGFNKTVVPVELARYGTDQLVSRSQAKRVLNRVDQFSQVIFDFRDVDMIGQAFADEIFRVFAKSHPEVELRTVHANAEIMGMIQATIKSGRPGYKG